MATDYSKLTTHDLAFKFLDATVDQWGVNREQVNSVLEEVKRRGIKDEFANTLWSFGAHKATGEAYEKVLKKHGDALVPSILKDELSGSGLNKALALWHGQPVEHAKGWAARWQGMKDAVHGIGVFSHKDAAPFVADHPYTSWTILTGAGVGLYFGGAAVAKAAPYVTGGFLLYEGWKVGKSEIDAATTFDPAKQEKSLEKSGEGLGNIGMILATEGTTKGLAYGFRFLKGAEALPWVTRGEEAFSLVTTKPKPGFFSPIAGDASMTMEGMDVTVQGMNSIEASASTMARGARPLFPKSLKPYYSESPLESGVRKNPIVAEGIADSLIQRLRNMVSGKDPVDLGSFEAIGDEAFDRLKELEKIYGALRNQKALARVVSKWEKLVEAIFTLEERYGTLKACPVAKVKP